MEDLYPSITQEDEQDILTRFLTWILEDNECETFVFITEGSLRSRFVEMTTEQEAKDLVQKYLDYQLDRGCAADEHVREQRLER